MSRALQSLSPAWVTNKEAGVSGIAPALGDMYPFLSDIDNAYELAGTPEGYYQPYGGSAVPANAAGAGGVTANPATAWTAGSSVPTLGGVMHWGGAAWADGAAT